MPRAATLWIALLLASSMRPVSASDCAEHGACCFPRADPYPPPLDRSSPRAGEAVSIAKLAVRGALSRPNVRRVLAGARDVSCGEVVKLVIAPSGVVVEVSRANGGGAVNAASACPALRALRFPAGSGVTEVELTLASPAR